MADAVKMILPDNREIAIKDAEIRALIPSGTSPENPLVNRQQAAGYGDYLLRSQPISGENSMVRLLAETPIKYEDNEGNIHEVTEHEIGFDGDNNEWVLKTVDNENSIELAYYTINGTYSRINTIAIRSLKFGDNEYGPDSTVLEIYTEIHLQNKTITDIGSIPIQANPASGYRLEWEVTTYDVQRGGSAGELYYGKDNFPFYVASKNEWQIFDPQTGSNNACVIYGDSRYPYALETTVSGPGKLKIEVTSGSGTTFYGVITEVSSNRGFCPFCEGLQVIFSKDQYVEGFWDISCDEVTSSSLYQWYGTLDEMEIMEEPKIVEVGDPDNTSYSVDGEVCAAEWWYQIQCDGLLEDTKTPHSQIRVIMPPPESGRVRDTLLRASMSGNSPSSCFSLSFSTSDDATAPITYESETGTIAGLTEGNNLFSFTETVQGKMVVSKKNIVAV